MAVVQEPHSGRVHSPIVASAIEVLTGSARWPIGELGGHLDAVPGLYAVYGAQQAWEDLGLGLDVPHGPLYVGNSEDSFISRDLKTHFSSGKTGQSTIRRSFAALLHDSLALTGVPRHLTRPGHFANYGLKPADDERLTQWMFAHLSMSVWPKPSEINLRSVERDVVVILDPPINIEYLPREARRHLSHARRKMADEARMWRSD